MKKITLGLFVIILSALVFFLGFDTKKNIEPNYLYRVYLDDQVLGVIESKEALEDYIDEQGSTIKEQYGVEKVYPPNGLEIKRIITYDGTIDKIEEVYEKLSSLKPFTISGYQFTIKKDDGKEVIYVTDKNIFEEAIENAIITFVGQEEYDNYKNGNQVEIETTGTYLDNIYIDEDITIKETQIPVNETIYIDEEKLSQYILFGDKENATYIIKKGDTISSVSEDNKINTQEFLIANPEFTSADNILYPGQKVNITAADPVLSIVKEYTLVEDKESDFAIVEQKDPTINIGDDRISQKGEKGLDRITSLVKSVNGSIIYAKNTETEVLKPATSQIILVGTRYQSNIGGWWWAWPTQTRTISTGYGWRTLFGVTEFHQALDIYGNYYNKIYAANNGTITGMRWGDSYGYYITINHNNGYATLYAHMQAFAPNLRVGSTVARGQVIGYMGSTGNSTGPHVHFEVWRGSNPYAPGAYYINPWSIY